MKVKHFCEVSFKPVVPNLFNAVDPFDDLAESCRPLSIKLDKYRGFYERIAKKLNLRVGLFPIQ